MNELEIMVENGPTWASHRAQLALKYKRAHDEGAITDSELNELLEDLLRTDEIQGRQDNIVMKGNLIRAIRALMIIV